MCRVLYKIFQQVARSPFTVSFYRLLIPFFAFIFFLSIELFFLLFLLSLPIPSSQTFLDPLPFHFFYFKSHSSLLEFPSFLRQFNPSPFPAFFLSPFLLPFISSLLLSSVLILLYMLPLFLLIKLHACTPLPLSPYLYKVCTYCTY